MSIKTNIWIVIGFCISFSTKKLKNFDMFYCDIRKRLFDVDVWRSNII